MKSLDFMGKLTPTLAGQVESLPDLIIIPFAIDNRSSDLEQLQLLGEAASELQIPLEAMLTAQLAEDLGESGFTPFTCKPNRDSAYLLWVPMLHRAEVYDDEAATASSKAMPHLPYQLLACRISEAILSNIPGLRLGAVSANELGTAIDGFMQQFLANTGAGTAVNIEVQQEPYKYGKNE